MAYDKISVNPDDFFKIIDHVSSYKYIDLVDRREVIKYKSFPLTINLKSGYDYKKNNYLENLLLCDEINTHPLGVIVDFSDMECFEILPILEKIEGLFNEGKLNNIKFTFKYNQYTDNKNTTVGSVSSDFKLIKDTVVAVNTITDYISHFNLSEFEKIMFLYDLVKERPYEDNIASVLKVDMSKDKVLSEVLFNESIVCIGYSNIMTAVLRNLGIDASICNIDSKISEEDAHSVVIININDNKYGCSGKKLFFDVTNDNKDSFNYSENKYDGFGLSASQVDYLENGVYKFDCSKLKEIVDSERLEPEILKVLIANTRYIEHSIDDLKYGELLGGSIYDLNNDNYLDYDRELDARLLSSFRALLSLKLNQNLSDDSYDILKEFIEENPEYIDLLNDILKNITGSKSSSEIVDYTKNPVIPENIRSGRK